MGVLESAARASNVQYEQRHIIDRLSVRILNGNAGDSGWDVFSLDYNVDTPINLVFTEDGIETYLRCFKFLWRLKRVEHALRCVWWQGTNRLMKSQWVSTVNRHYPLKCRVFLLMRTPLAATRSSTTWCTPTNSASSRSSKACCKKDSCFGTR